MRLWPILLLALATPALAQSPTQGPPDMGIDTSGVLRKLSVRDATLGSRVPLAILDTTTHSFAAPAVLVEAYGAISGDAGDDRANIQTAVTAATATSRCVSGSGKTYLVNGNVVLPNGGCLIDIKLVETGTGARRPITSDCGSGSPWTQCEGPYTLRRVKVDRGLSDSQTDSAGIYFAHASKGLLLEDVEVTGNGAGQGIGLPFSSNIKIIRPWIHDMEWTNTSGVDPGIEQITGFFCASCSNLEIVNLRIENMWGTIPWVAGQSLTLSQGLAWRTNAGNAYKTKTFPYPTASGTTAPTCTGTPDVTTCSDGLVTWTYMGPAATTKRAYQADGTGFSGADNVTILGGLIQNTWEGIDIGASNNVWLYGLTYKDIDSWGEKWCHSDTNSGSVGSRAIRAGIAGFVTCQQAAEAGMRHHRIIDAISVDTGANGNWLGSHPGFWASYGTDIQFINTIAVDTQAVPTMTEGYRIETPAPVVGAPAILINPYSSGHTGSARTGTWDGVLEGPYGSAVAANTGTTGHVVPFTDGINLWSGGGNRFQINAVGAQTIPLGVQNGGGSANAEVVIDLSPNNNAVGARSAQIASVSSTGSNDANLVFRTANGNPPVQVGSFGKGNGGFMVGQSSVTDPGIGSIHVQFGMQLGVVAVGSLPTCNAALEGMIRGVSDANSVVFNAAVVGGGSNHMMAYCNGTGWAIR